MGKKDKIIQELALLIKEQAKTIAKLEKKLSELEDEVARLKSPKNSRNSSVPPSKDENRKTRSLRVKTGRKPGGQHGHEGSTLSMSSTPDQIIVHSPCWCQTCGKDISKTEGTIIQRRQIADIPVVRAIYVEHQSISKKCSCGHITTTGFPSHVKAPVQYGPRVESLIGYLSARQYMPYNRLSELLTDAFHLPISEGSIDNLLKRFSQKAQLAYDRIKENISGAQVIGADETGAKINGQKAWVHTWQTTNDTFLAISMSRGKKAIEENFPRGFAGAVLVSDAWPAQLATPARGHQLCMAHMMRELNYFIEAYKSTWACNMKELFNRALKLKNTNITNIELNDLAIDFDKLLFDQSHPSEAKKIKAFKKRLIKNKNSIFTFLYEIYVPPDNNASERAIRNVKVKQKVSGQFKSLAGAQIFVKIRSVIDTAIKRKANVLDCLFLTANLVAE